MNRNMKAERAMDELVENNNSKPIIDVMNEYLGIINRTFNPVSSAELPLLLTAIKIYEDRLKQIEPLAYKISQDIFEIVKGGIRHEVVSIEMPRQKP